jgi:glycolate oxidase FAD binding subunit
MGKLVEHAHEDMTATVQAGSSVARFQEELSKKRQRLAVDVLWPERTTIGGMIATNDSGALRLRFGSIRDLLIGTTVVLADGTIARSGGKVVKNVAGYDLPKLFTGSFGTLGVLTEVTFRLHPLPHSVETLSFRFPNEVSANKFILAVNNSTMVPASMQLRCGSDQPTEVDVLFEGVEAGIAAQTSAILKIVSDGQQIQPAISPWSARQEIWNMPSQFVCKVSMLPTEIATLIGELRWQCTNFQAVIQGTGLGYFSASCSPPAIQSLRSTLAKNNGSLVVLLCPPEMAKSIDRFGTLPNTIVVMARVKQRFDPNGILNRGRFIGGL